MSSAGGAGDGPPPGSGQFDEETLLNGVDCTSETSQTKPSENELFEETPKLAEPAGEEETLEPEPAGEEVEHDAKEHRTMLQHMRNCENEEEFSAEFSAFVSINDNAISTPTTSEAPQFGDIESGSLHMLINLRLPTRDYSTVHISCYAYGIGIDNIRLAHLTIFLQDVVSVSTGIHPEPLKSLEAYCPGAKPVTDPVVISLRAQKGQVRLPQGILNKLGILNQKGQHVARQLRTICEEIGKDSFEIKLLLPGHKSSDAEYFTEAINFVMEDERNTDPLSSFFRHAPEAKTFTKGDAPKPGSLDFPSNAQEFQLMRFANAEQHLVHNIASLMWEQAIQDRMVEELSSTPFTAVIIPLGHKNKDLLVVKVDGREDIFPQNGDSCDVFIEDAIFNLAPVERNDVSLAIVRAVIDSEDQIEPLVSFNKSCSELLVRPLTEEEFKEFSRNEEEREADDHEGFTDRVSRLCNDNDQLVKQSTTPQTRDNDEGEDEEPAEDDSKHTFRGHCVSSDYHDIPRGFHTMLISHPRSDSGSKAKLPYASFKEGETLTAYISRVGDGGLTQIKVKMSTSEKTLKAQSHSLNSLKHPVGANAPSPQSVEAYQYLLNFDLTKTSPYNLLTELPGVGNVIVDRASPKFMLDIFDNLTAPMKRCLTEMDNAPGRLHFISGVAGAGKSYLMEVLMLFTLFGKGFDNTSKPRILYILNNNVGVETFCQRLGQTFEDWLPEEHASHRPDIMRVYPLEGEVRNTSNSVKPQQDIEVDNLAEAFEADQVLQELCTDVIENQAAAKRTKNANRDKSLHRYASDSISNHPERHSYLQGSLERIKNGDTLSEDQYASFKQQIKTVYRDTIREFSGIMVTTAVGAYPAVIREELKPELIIIDEAATMDEASLFILIANFAPKAWVITGDIAQKPPHLTMEHDLGPGKVSSNPFAVQKQTSVEHRVVEGGAKHSSLSMNMRAHGNVARPASHLFYNDIMSTKHKWESDNVALHSMIGWFTQNVNENHPEAQCVAQVEFSHARVTQRSSSKVNVTHAEWVIRQVASLLESDLRGVGKNSGKPMTVLVVATYKEQVVELKQRFLKLANVSAAHSDRFKFKTVDNAQGDEADFVIYDMVTTSTPAFVAAEFRSTLGLSRARAFVIILANRGNFIGHEVNKITQARALELSRVYDFVASLGVNKRIASCKRCETSEHSLQQCTNNDPDMSDKTCERTSCGETGHTAAFCPTRFCGNCSERGHTSGECPFEHFLCSACGRRGHHYFNCDTSGKTLWCENCKASGHTHFRCPQRSSNQGQQSDSEKKQRSFNCHNCGESGHKADQCTQPTKQRPCEICGEVGHWKATCPKRECKWCGEAGHTADVCTRDHCNRCMQLDHLAADCNNGPPACSVCGGPHLTRNHRDKKGGKKGNANKKPFQDPSSEPGFTDLRRQILDNRGPSNRLQAYNSALKGEDYCEAPGDTQNNGGSGAWDVGDTQNNGGSGDSGGASGSRDWWGTSAGTQNNGGSDACDESVVDTQNNGGSDEWVEHDVDIQKYSEADEGGW
jgi:hypothetical protein